MALSGGWAKASRVLHTATTIHVLLAVGALVLVTSVLYLIKHSRDAGLDHIPGPWLARYSNLHAWIEAQRWHGSDVCYLRRLHEKHGPVVRVAPRRVSVCDPDAIPTIYGMRASLDKVGSASHQPDYLRLANVCCSLTSSEPRNPWALDPTTSSLCGRPKPMPLCAGLWPMPTPLAPWRSMKFESTTRWPPSSVFWMAREGRPISGSGRIIVSLHRVEEPLFGGILLTSAEDVYDVQGSMTFAEPLGYLENRNDAVGLIWQSE
jgi:hypothetical protein